MASILNIHGMTINSVILLTESLHHRADAPIIGYLLEFSSDIEYRTGYDERGHNLGSMNDALPKPQRLTWELNEEVGNITKGKSMQTCTTTYMSSYECCVVLYIRTLIAGACMHAHVCPHIQHANTPYTHTTHTHNTYTQHTNTHIHTQHTHT